MILWVPQAVALLLACLVQVYGWDAVSLPEPVWGAQNVVHSETTITPDGHVSPGLVDATQTGLCNILITTISAIK